MRQTYKCIEIFNYLLIFARKEFIILSLQKAVFVLQAKIMSVVNLKNFSAAIVNFRQKIHFIPESRNNDIKLLAKQQICHQLSVESFFALSFEFTHTNISAISLHIIDIQINTPDTLVKFEKIGLALLVHCRYDYCMAAFGEFVGLGYDNFFCPAGIVCLCQAI